jgi:hypothetical protein
LYVFLRYPANFTKLKESTCKSGRQARIANGELLGVFDDVKGAIQPTPGAIAWQNRARKNIYVGRTFPLGRHGHLALLLRSVEGFENGFGFDIGEKFGLQEYVRN